MKKIIIGVIIGFCVLSVIIGLATIPGRNAGKKLIAGGGTIAVIRVEGVITGGRSAGGFLGVQAGSDTIIEQIRSIEKDPNIKAVVLRINSPGGSAPAAEEIGMELERLKKKGKIIVASMGDAAASGGYWIATKADKIFAIPSTMTGSIGVIMSLYNYQELYEKLGIENETIKSGPHKDIGSPTREMTPQEREIFQGMVDDIYTQFINTVAKGRKMDIARVKELADGRVYTGRQAKELGLVDELGNYYDALDAAAKMAGIKGENYQVKEIGRTSPLQMFFGSSISKEDLLNLIYPLPLDPIEILISTQRR